MAADEVGQQFPKMRPIRRPPALFMRIGCGITLYGKRDYESEFGTSVTTRCLCLFFIPLFTLGAYRVIPGEGDHLILGREPLSWLARAWNVVVTGGFTAAILSGLWVWHSRSPEYFARHELKVARAHAATGDFADAAYHYLLAIEHGTRHGISAEDALKRLMENFVETANLEPAIELFTVVADAVEQGRIQEDRLDVLQHGVRIIGAHMARNPRGAYRLLKVIQPLDADGQFLPELKLEMLEQLVTLYPENSEIAAELAVVYEAREQFDKCVAVLEPHVNWLGANEGARILGQIYAREGRLDEAYPLLLAYCEPRLQLLHEAEEGVRMARMMAQRDAIERFREGSGSLGVYDQWDGADESKRQWMLEQYLQFELKKDAGLQTALARVRDRAAIIPVALDLGLLTLRRAESIDEPAERQAHLDRARALFLTLRGTAGQAEQSAPYKLALARIDYWLGEPARARQTLAEIIDARGTDPQTQLFAANLLREVGAMRESRALLEEIYARGEEEKVRYAAALLRSTAAISLDDRIEWLERSNPANPEVAAEKAKASAQRALLDGKDEQAAADLRRAVETYESQVRTSVTLNNGALAYFELFRVTGSATMLDKGTTWMIRAAELKPGDSLVVGNAARAAQQTALRQVMLGRIDLDELRMLADWNLLPFLYDGRDAMDEVSRQIRDEAQLGPARILFERAAALTPKNPEYYVALARIYRALQLPGELVHLLERLEGAEIEYPAPPVPAAADPGRARQLQSSIGRLRETLDTTRERTMAITASVLVDQMVQAANDGLDVNDGEIVALAERAVSARPSAGTRSRLVVALLHRASRQISGQDETYRALADKHARHTRHHNLLLLAMGADDRLRQRALENDDVQHAVRLCRPSAGSMPFDIRLLAWALMHQADPDVAAQLAQQVSMDEAGWRALDIESRLDRGGRHLAALHYWSLRCRNDERADAFFSQHWGQ